MAGINQTFDATQWAPQQSGGSTLPVGKHLVTISKTEIAETSNKDGGMFVVTFAGDGGEIKQRYNLWNKSEMAVKIAHGQLSALCHATGIFRVNFGDEGRALIGGKCMVEVDHQSQSEADREAGKTPYSEVKLVLDINGNEPGKPASTPAAAGWGGAQQAPAAAPANPATIQAPSNATAVADPAPWQQQAPAADATPPWARQS